MSLLFCLLTALTAGDSDWPQFRGPTGQGLADSTTPPLHFSGTENLAWKKAVPGEGWSSPVVAAGKVYLTTAVASDPKNAKSDRSLRALAFDLERGSLLWNKEVFKLDGRSAPRIHFKNGHASPTPAFDGGRLFVHFGHQGTACLSADGEILWSTREISYKPVHGAASCPVLAGKLVVLTCDAASNPFLVALDRETGRIVWRRERATDAKKTFSFCTPLLIDVAGKSVLVTPGSNVVLGLDPATGEEIWRVRYDGYSVVPRPSFGLGMVFVSTSFDSPQVLAIRPDGKGDVTDSNVVWRNGRAAPSTPSMLLVGENLFTCADNGVVSCVDARTGASHWQKRLLGPTSASGVEAAGRIYWFDENGKGIVFKAADQAETLVKVDLKERIFSSPALAGGKLLVRTEKHLFCFEEKK